LYLGNFLYYMLIHHTIYQVLSIFPKERGLDKWYGVLTYNIENYPDTTHYTAPIPIIGETYVK